jgi:hypothetical protein
MLAPTAWVSRCQHNHLLILELLTEPLRQKIAAAQQEISGCEQPEMQVTSLSKAES